MKLFISRENNLAFFSSFAKDMFALYNLLQYASVPFSRFIVHINHV